MTMMTMLRLSLILSSAILFATAARAQDASQLAQSKGCMGCHDVSQKKVGPSFSSLAAKYKGQANASSKLVDELKNGTGHRKISASDAELQQLVAYVLATP